MVLYHTHLWSIVTTLVQVVLLEIMSYIQELNMLALIFFFTQEKAMPNEVTVDYTPSQEQVADKPLSLAHFQELKVMLNMSLKDDVKKINKKGTSIF